MFTSNRVPYTDLRLTHKNQCMDTIGSRIKARRKKLGLTQVDLAVAIGIKQPSLSDIENNVTQDMAATTLAGLCRELRVTPEYVVFGIGPDEDENLAIQEAELLYILRMMPPESRDQLVNTARSFVVALKPVLPPGMAEPITPRLPPPTH